MIAYSCFINDISKIVFCFVVKKNPKTFSFSFFFEIHFWIFQNFQILWRIACSFQAWRNFFIRFIQNRILFIWWNIASFRFFRICVFSCLLFFQSRRICHAKYFFQFRSFLNDSISICCRNFLFYVISIVLRRLRSEFFMKKTIRIRKSFVSLFFWLRKSRFFIAIIFCWAFQKAYILY